MTHFNRLLLLVLVIALLLPATAFAEPTPPGTLAHQTVDNVLSSMKGRREELRKNPQELYNLIDKELVPLLDLPYMSQLVLGRYWRQASPQERQRFETAFKNMLIRTYGSALLGFKDADQVKYMPVRAPKGAKDVTFHAEIKSDDGQTVPVSLKLHLVNDHWEVYDGNVGNLDFVANYRGQFSAQLRHGSLKQLIQQMEQRYAPGSNNS